MTLGRCEKVYSIRAKGIRRNGFEFKNASAVQPPNPRYHRRLARVPDFRQGRQLKASPADLARGPVRRFLAVIPPHRRDAYATFRSTSALRTRRTDAFP